MVSNILCGYSNYSVDKWGYGWAVSFITELPSSISGTFTNVNTQDINITGNAATATKLTTARTINGTSFDGSANITTANWGTARNISIADSDSSNTGTAVSVNGSAAATLKLPATIKATLKGNADTASKLLHNQLDNIGYATDDTHILKLGYFTCTGGFDHIVLLFSSAFWGN